MQDKMKYEMYEEKNMTKDFHHLVWKPFWGREAIKGHCSLVCKAQCLPSLHYVLFFSGAMWSWTKVVIGKSRLFFRVNPEHHQLTSSAHPTRTHRTKVSLMSAVWITSSSFATSKYITSSKHHHCDRRWFKCTFLRHLLLTLAVSRRHECFRCC